MHVAIYSAPNNVVTAMFPLDTNDCIPQPCKNGGACTDKVNAYTCTCIPGYAGGDCQTGMLNILIILILLCIIFVHIALNFTNWNIYMVTVLIFSDINDCDPIPCNNGGACTDKVNGYTCTCVVGYTGTNCQTGLLNI